MSIRLIFACLLIFGAAHLEMKGQSVTRGSYLQNATDSAISIKWRTDSLTNGYVWYGSSPTALLQVETSPFIGYDHTVRIRGLSPSSTYYYAVGDSTGQLEGADSSHWFRTNPVPGSTAPFTIWTIGDFGRNNDPERWVRDQYSRYAKANGPADMWLWLGDNAYDAGTDLQYQTNVFNVYDSIFAFQTFWTTPGNHDYQSVNQNGFPATHTGPYYSIVEVPFDGEAGGLPSGGEMYYSFDYGNCHFVSLNSELATWVTLPNSPMAQWLATDLATTQQPWKIVFFHKPPHTKGSHNSDNFWETDMISMRLNFAPIIEQYGVDLVLCGHSHVYERSRPVFGFYDWSWMYNASYEMDHGDGSLLAGTPYQKSLSGPTPNRGTVYTVVGNSGSVVSWAPLNHPMMVRGWGCDSCAGSLLIDVHNDSLIGRYYGSDGLERDEFAIVKDLTIGATPALPPVIQMTMAWPDPFTSELEVSFLLMKASDLEMEIVDMMGQIVHRTSLARKGPGEHRIDLSAAVASLAAGPYLLRMRGGDAAAQRKIIKLAP